MAAEYRMHAQAYHSQFANHSYMPGHLPDSSAGPSSSASVSPRLQLQFLRKILDEGTSFQSNSPPDALTMAALLRADRKWILTGTPTSLSSLNRELLHTGTAAGTAAVADITAAAPVSRDMLWESDSLGGGGSGGALLGGLRTPEVGLYLNTLHRVILYDISVYEHTYAIYMLCSILLTWGIPWSSQRWTVWTLWMGGRICAITAPATGGRWGWGVGAPPPGS